MKLTMVIESAQDSTLVPRLIPLLATKPMAEILEEPFVAPLLPPLLERAIRSISILARAPNCKMAPCFLTSPIRISKATTSLCLIICNRSPSIAWV
jgi:hypothetical protein